MTDIPEVPRIPRSTLPSRQPLAVLVFALFAILILYLAGRIIAAYATPILLALVIVTFSYGIYERLVVRMKGRRSLAAIVMLIAIVLVLVLPALTLGYLLVQQATALFKMLQATDVRQTLEAFDLDARLAFVKRVVPTFDPSTIQPELYILRVVKQIPAWVAAHGPAVFGGFAAGVLGFFLMLLAAYFFYVDGKKLARQVKFLSPLPDEYDDEIFRRFRGVIDATFRGQILTAIAQGVVTAIGMWIAGVPAALFWGAVAAVFALIPMVGPAMIWIPSAIYLFAGQGARGGGLGWGIFMIAWGIIIVGLVDNVIRPWAMKGGVEMSAIVLFFAILGGLQVFGFVGILLGPLVFALLDVVIHMYKHFFAKTLEEQNVGEVAGM